MKKSCGLLAGLVVLALALAQMASAADLYVTTNGTGNGSSWASPTNSIQGAIDNLGVVDGDTVWVSNGVYEVGGRAGYPDASFTTTNRIAIWKAITVRSANNDPTNTVIKGAWDPNAGVDNYGVGPAAVRCVWMTNGSSLIGFTLTNGATQLAASKERDIDGGGVHCSETYGAVISNCVITGCSAVMGGGAFLGTFYNCAISNNSTPYWGFTADRGGGVRYSELHNCTLTGNKAAYGGGAQDATLYNCTLSGNRATYYAGGSWNSTLYNCKIIGNVAEYQHGGGGKGNNLYNCVLSGNSAALYGGGQAGEAGYMMYNCTVVSNFTTGAGDYGGGVSGCGMYNCIVYFNTTVSGNGPNWSNMTGATNSCTIGGTGQVDFVTDGNITNPPLFADWSAGNYRLSPNSPCINAGTNQSWMTNSAWVSTYSPAGKDLDGGARIRYITVDMGAYEFLNKGTIVRVK